MMHVYILENTELVVFNVINYRKTDQLNET